MPGKAKNKYSLGGKAGAQGIELTLPTGDVCLVRRPGAQGLIATGVLDSFDSIASLVSNEHFRRIEGKAPMDLDAEAVKALMGSKDALADALAMVDRVVEYCVMEPRVVRPVRRDESSGKPIKDPATGKEYPLEDSERDEGTLYTDDVDIENRMFILNFAVGGSSDLDSFRTGLRQSVGDVEAIAGVALPAE